MITPLIVGGPGPLCNGLMLGELGNEVTWRPQMSAITTERAAGRCGSYGLGVSVAPFGDNVAAKTLWATLIAGLTQSGRHKLFVLRKTCAPHFYSSRCASLGMSGSTSGGGAP